MKQTDQFREKKEKEFQGKITPHIRQGAVGGSLTFRRAARGHWWPPANDAL